MGESKCYLKIHMWKTFLLQFISVLWQFEIWGNFSEDRLVSSQILKMVRPTKQAGSSLYYYRSSPPSQGLRIIPSDFKESIGFIKVYLHTINIKHNVFLVFSLTFQIDSKSRLFCETITSWLITWSRRSENTDCFSGLHLPQPPLG